MVISTEVGKIYCPESFKNDTGGSVLMGEKGN